MSPVILVIIVLLVILACLVAAFVMLGRGTTRFTFDIGGGVPRASGGNDSSAETGFKNRLLGLSVFAGSVIGALLLKLWSMQLVSADDYSAQAESNRTRTISVVAPRGRILDRHGSELVSNRASLCVVAKSDVAGDAIEVKLLANLIGMPAMAVKRKIESTSEGAQSMRTVAEDVSRRIVAYIDEHTNLFPGVQVTQRTQRLYPNGSLAAHVLGYTGAITADQVDALGKASGGSISYELGDTVGQAGIEYQYESVLQGIKGTQTVYVDADGNVLSTSSKVEPQSGSDITLTIDKDVQAAAEASLAGHIKRLHDAGRQDCNGGAVVVLDATNGDVLALASYPTYSPNVFVGGIANDDWTDLSSDAANNPMLNRAIAGQYPSGSVIKPLTAFAALNYGIATDASTYVCTGYWTGFGTGSGQYCWNKSGHGSMTLETGIVNSCDVVFYEIGKGFFYADDPEGMQETFRAWGLGSKEGIDLPGEAAGRVPDAAWKRDYYASYSSDDSSWKGGDDTNLAIGQGDLLVTPLQMCCVYAGIAMGGTVYKPHLLKSVDAAVGAGTVIDYKASETYQVNEADDNLSLVRRALKGVIYQESAAQASHFTTLPVTVAGKTGSAETAKSQPDGWFVAYAPYDAPRYVIAATIEYGGYGNEGAMLVVRDVLGQIYDCPDTSTQQTSSGER
ncbi:penicillin-binding protein 2 [Olsenella massiliensis]|uniref:penicillin-binding protein 2 n=1 Tax=Olsenella massiliensis TaxID=1622075 RepID=UPI00071DD5A3|nr:penicillin-binding protein 2 [Olsenella massiliensis]